MASSTLTGPLYATAATSAIGLSVAVSKLLIHYPVLSAQAVRYGTWRCCWRSAQSAWPGSTSCCSRRCSAPSRLRSVWWSAACPCCSPSLGRCWPAGRRPRRSWPLPCCGGRRGRGARRRRGHRGWAGRGADLDHARGGAQLQRLDQEPGERGLVADTEPRDRDVVWGLVGGKDPKRDVLVAASFDLPGGAHANAAGIEEHGEQGLGVVGGWPCRRCGGLGRRAKGRAGRRRRARTKRGGLGPPVAQVGRQQVGLVAVAAQEAVGYSLFYSFAALKPNVLIPTYQGAAQGRRSYVADGRRALRSLGDG
jgi:hypothetical protein